MNTCNASLALDTATPYLATYPGAQACEKANYLLRWVNTTSSLSDLGRKQREN